MLQGAVILLVEDNIINQEVAKAMLNQRGMIVEIAENGMQAVAMVRDNAYDCVLMDIQMPVMDGNIATRIIREKLKYIDLPILAMTAKVLENDIKEAMSSGMNCHIAKPIDLELLLNEIAYWINLSRTDVVTTTTQEQESNDDIMAECLKNVGGDITLFLKILAVFLDKHSTDYVKIIKMLEEGKRGEARKTVHGLKGVSLVVGASELHAISVELESLLLEESVDITTLLEDFKSQLQRTVKDLNVYIVRNQQ